MSLFWDHQTQSPQIRNTAQVTSLARAATLLLLKVKVMVVIIITTTIDDFNRRHHHQYGRVVDILLHLLHPTVVPCLAAVAVSLACGLVTFLKDKNSNSLMYNYLL